MIGSSGSGIRAVRGRRGRASKEGEKRAHNLKLEYVLTLSITSMI